MQPEFWLERWRLKQIAFHQSSVHPKLLEFWPRFHLKTASRVLVPLCGKSLDMLWLLAQGHHVIGVELSETALESFCTENGIPARRKTHGDFIVYEAPHLQLYCGDFFKLTAAQLQPVAAVYDRAALISWTPDLRMNYVQHLTALTTYGSTTLLITMEYLQTQMNGPPFAVARDDVQRAYGAHYSIQELDRQDTLPLEPRLRARGLDQLYETCYQLTRT